MCPQCRAFITTSDKVCPYCNTQVGPRAVEQRDPGPILGGLIPHAQFVTSMILLLNFGLYAATALYSSRSGAGGSTMASGGGWSPPASCTAAQSIS
jgi:rhomboid protease GluP